MAIKLNPHLTPSIPRDVAQDLEAKRVAGQDDFEWTSQLRWAAWVLLFS